MRVYFLKKIPFIINDEIKLHLTREKENKKKNPVLRMSLRSSFALESRYAFLYIPFSSTF